MICSTLMECGIPPLLFPLRWRIHLTTERMGILRAHDYMRSPYYVIYYAYYALQFLDDMV